MGVPALFLDRDGVINVDTGYLHRPQDCVFIRGIFDLVRRANAAGMLVFVVTNQAGIARGYYDEERYQAFTAWMLQRFAEQGARIERVYHCPHHPTAGLGDYLRVCDCRKPAAGMLLAARDAYGLEMGRSAMVGDTATDMRAAAAAGIGQRWFFRHAGGTAMPGEAEVSCTVVSALEEIDPAIALARQV